MQGLVGLVTGAASGLGKATAVRLVNQGAKAVICDLPSSQGAEVAKELGENAIFCSVDVRIEYNFLFMTAIHNCAIIRLGLLHY